MVWIGQAVRDLSCGPCHQVNRVHMRAAVVIDEKLYIVGGSRNGRYLSDVQITIAYKS
ncbi:acyl-CoA-binding domain-containing protein 4 [Artemisia annua]|uniref:Acyl-CoA-binding domain-containing protein 4 n=1 Tax=Artemisia annua TaxID=35608 RepID=A0A2U1NCL7_ARTAN|nr:acyl-CoA-binding domain-containing protein 4 [Artemisia annua]